MFREHTHYTATCAACGYTARDRRLSRALGWPVTLWIISLEPAPAVTGAAYSDGPWAVEDGQLRCSDCASDSVAASPEELVEHLTQVARYTLHCDTCHGALKNEEDDPDEPTRFAQRELCEVTVSAMRYLEWEVVETTPIQPQAVLVDIPNAPDRTWHVTCPECVEDAAWRRDLAAAGAA